jgi:hypothetical protein
MNDTGTSSSISAETDPSVRLRGQLLEKRRLFGAYTPGGHRCSNLDELLQNRGTATGEQLRNIEASIARQVGDLSSMSIGPAAFTRNVTKLSIERLREVLDYDPLTGALKWRFRTSPNAKLDEPAGAIGKHGYRKIRLDDRYYPSSHLAWFHYYGVTPAGLIDHENGDKSDDRIENLRLATASQNSMNQGRNRNNTTGFKGVAVFNKPGEPTRYRAVIRPGGKGVKRRFLGIFDTPEEAHQAYCKAAEELHGEFARTS